MATVIGIFEHQYLNNQSLTIVKPEIKQDDLLINDTVEVCYNAFKANKMKYYSISNLKSYSILSVAKMFKTRLYF